MLRIAFLVLLLANAGYYAWSAGLLRSVGLAPADPSEPHRIEQQIRPEILRVQPPAGAGAAGAPRAQNAGASPAAPATASPVASAQPAEPVAASGAPAVASCLQAGPFDQRQADTLRVALAATGLPADAWSLEGTPVSSRWMVYMGRFADDEALAKKRAELRARNVPYDRPGAALEPGLSLGRFSTEEAAERALATLGNQGVRTARVVQERTGASTDYTLRLPAVTDAMAPRIDQLRPALGGKPLRAC
ncbi:MULTISPECIES: SPOR domain-containing protein [unclassified Acidovorax]|uniref:SPOR domain-containing protein n=1 Tax=unclassified Acidovorax TaxID=2684926 RepID=UPI0028835135|nr:MULTISPECIES: SPOR domain-containing protein [unclassified Acidovorax]